MTEPLASVVAGYGEPGVPERDAETWVSESTGLVALIAARRTYGADPGLWRLGEHGRARTVEDLTHHLRAVLGGDGPWRQHVDYSIRLFDARGFPQRWLRDAFATLRDALAEAFAPALLTALADEAGIDLNRPTKYDAAAG